MRVSFDRLASGQSTFFATSSLVLPSDCRGIRHSVGSPEILTEQHVFGLQQ